MKTGGGVVWHTQGSGKSLTMVLLAKAIALDPNLQDAKIILVTDRVDLDDQIFGTFQNCDTEPVRAASGKEPAAHLQNPDSRIITAVINKFDAAAGKLNVRLESENIFVLVDESHRAQYGPLHGRIMIFNAPENKRFSAPDLLHTISVICNTRRNYKQL